jgi:hypothetical protein
MEVEAMKTFIVAAVMLSLAAPALAKLAPVARGEFMPERQDTNAIFLGPVGAMLESGYFQATPASATVGGLFPCRLDRVVFDKHRLLHVCN